MDGVADVEARIAEVRRRVGEAANRVGRDARDVTLIAVSKTHGADLVAAAARAGLRDFGENRVQEALDKIPQVVASEPLRWHLIGHLQRNKARRAAEVFSLIHSVDSLRLAEALARHAHETLPGGRLPILLQINIAGEAQKEGFDLAGGPANRAALAAFYADVERVLQLPALEVRGLMTIAPYVSDPRLTRPAFQQLRALRDDLAGRYPQCAWSELSMGMTNDFEVAIEEGATLVRVGRAIFGERA